MLNLTLRRLEVFVSVVEAGGFAAAADRLGIAQPSVSSHIVALETKAGGKLFDRPRGRKPSLTPLGLAFLARAQVLLAEASALSGDIERRRQERQRLVFACQRSLANYVFTSALAHFAREHAQTEVVVRIGMQEDVHAQVEQGLADLGCLLSNTEPPNFASVTIGRQRLVVVAAPTHPLVGRVKVAPAELQEHAFVSPPASSMFGQQVDALLRGIGVAQRRTVFQATEYQFIRELVIAGVGLSCSGLTSVERDLRTGALALIDVDAPPLTLDIRQIFSPRRGVLPAVRTFADYLRDHCDSADIFHATA